MKMECSQGRKPRKKCYKNERRVMVWWKLQGTAETKKGLCPIWDAEPISWTRRSLKLSCLLKFNITLNEGAGEAQPV
jgi:hypothetical protein